MHDLSGDEKKGQNGGPKPPKPFQEGKMALGEKKQNKTLQALYVLRIHRCGIFSNCVILTVNVVCDENLCAPQKLSLAC